MSVAFTTDWRDAADPERSAWVSANAGSGKTYTLANRVTRLLLAKATPAKILCLTYTKAAAAEMQGRLFDQLGQWSMLPDDALRAEIEKIGGTVDGAETLSEARRLFAQALETPGGLKIQTIHAFCERLLHLFPVEAGIAPGFRVMDEREAREIQETAIRHVLHRAESGAEPELAESFARLAERLSEDQFDELIRSFVEALRKWNGTPLTLQNYQSVLKEALDLAAEDADWAAIDRETYAHHARQLEPYVTATNTVAHTLHAIARADDPRDLLIAFHLTQKFEPRKELLLKKAREAMPEVDAFLKQEQARILDALCRANTRGVIKASADALTLASAILARIENEKRESGRYDFSDLISRTARLLSSQRATQWVLFKLDASLTHILLDEAQDTGPDQWAMIEALAQEFFAGQGVERRDNRTLFVVGDRKQSIYSFQGADVSAYSNAEEQFVANGRLHRVNLDVSYRSTAEVLAAVDKVFTESAHTASRIGEPGLVEIWPLVAADDEADDEPWTKPVDRPPQSSASRKLARVIATQIAGWLDAKRPRKLAGQNRAVNAGDILILFRSRGPFKERAGGGCRPSRSAQVAHRAGSADASVMAVAAAG